MKNFAGLLVAASLGLVSLGAAACDGDETPAGPPSASPSASSPASPPASSPSQAPAGAAPAPSSPEAAPPSMPARPKVTGSQVIMIDPSGKKYSRKEMVQMAAGMAAANEGQGLPSDFCARSYQDGVDEGGKFPAGRLAFIEACQEGLRLAG